jgi:hypothetical protein
MTFLPNKAKKRFVFNRHVTMEVQSRSRARWKCSRGAEQVGEMLLHEGVEAYKKEGSKFMQRLVAKQKAWVKPP